MTDTILDLIVNDESIDPAFRAALRVQSATFAAEYTTGRQPMLTFTRIENGRRTRLATMAVSGKREARKLAADRGATCWNF